MANPFDDIEDDTPPPAPAAETPAPKANAFDDIEPDIDHPVDDRQYGASMKQIARASLATTPELEMKRYAQQFNQPETDFQIHGDRIIRRVPETGTWAYVIPGKDADKGLGGKMGRFGDWVASGTGQAIPAATGGLGAAGGTILGAPLGPGAIGTGMAGGAALGAAGEVVREKADRYFAEDHDTPIDWENVGWQGVQNAAGPAVDKFVLGPLARLATAIPGVSETLAKYGLRTKGQLEALSQKVAQSAKDGHPLGFLPDDVLHDIGQHLRGQWEQLEQVTKDAKDLGIDSLSLGQRTNSPVLKKIERWLATTPEGAERMGRTRQLQNVEQVPTATRKALDDIAPEAAPDAAVGPFREGAEKVVQDAADQQAKQAKEAYAAALDDPARPLHYSDDMKALVQQIGKWNPTLLKEAQSSAEARGYEFPALLNFDASGAPKLSGQEPNWRAMDFLKRALSGVEEGNRNSIGRLNNTGDTAKTFRQTLTGMLDDQNPLYPKARSQFGNSAESIDQILSGGVGKLQAMEGPDRLDMLNKVFSGSDNSLLAPDVAEARSLFVKAGKENEWKSATRAYLERGLDKALTPTESGDTGNVAGKMRKFWGTQNQRDVLRAALGDNAKADKMGRFMDVMETTSRMLPEASPTGTNAEFSKKNASRIGQMVRGAYGVVTGHGIVDRGLQALDDHLTAIAEPEARRKLVDFMMSPGATQSLDKLLTNMPRPAAIKASPAARDRAVKQIGTLMAAAGIPIAVDSRRGGEDQP